RCEGCSGEPSYEHMFAPRSRLEVPGKWERLCKRAQASEPTLRLAGEQPQAQMESRCRTGSLAFVPDPRLRWAHRRTSRTRTCMGRVGGRWPRCRSTADVRVLCSSLARNTAPAVATYDAGVAASARLSRRRDGFKRKRCFGTNLARALRTGALVATPRAPRSMPP